MTIDNTFSEYDSGYERFSVDNCGKQKTRNAVYSCYNKRGSAPKHLIGRANTTIHRLSPFNAPNGINVRKSE